MTATQDFLLEIGCEEMPSAPLIHAQAQLGQLVEEGLTEVGLAHGSLRTLSTPRRLAVIVESVALATQEVHESLRGPAVAIAFDAEGNPTKAAYGFARKNGIDTDDLVRRAGDDGREYVFVEKNIPSKEALPILRDLCEQCIAALEWPNYRSQRWGSEHQPFVRPIRWICALLGTEVIPVQYADVESSHTTQGHRVLAPGRHVVSEPAVYEQVLESAFVLGEQRRRELILAGVQAIEAARDGAHVDTPRRVLDEVVNLCEWPTVLTGSFDEAFLKVPREIICESMLSHQRYFPIYAADGNLTREFVVVSNADPAVSDTVIAGNERVVRARLDDAKFFYDEDLKVGLSAFRERLGSVVFQKSLGTMLQKSERMEQLAAAVAEQVSSDATLRQDSARAAHLAKADLVSQTVIEFTSQQGVMGGYYASAQGERDVVAQAISQQYRPRFAGDALPDGIVGKAVAIADKLDTICGMFAIDEPPTGSADPFAVRRCAIGVIAMLRALSHTSLHDLIEVSLQAYAAQGLHFDHPAVAAKVGEFFAGRLVAIAREAGIAPDVIEAVSSVGVIDPEEFIARAQALDEARAKQPELFNDLAVAYTRAAHLGAAELGTKVDETLMGDSERALLDACHRGAQNVENSLANGDYRAACHALAALREPIDRFFDEVLVMDDDTRLRENRLRLLNRFAAVFAGVANIGALSRTK